MGKVGRGKSQPSGIFDDFLNDFLRRGKDNTAITYGKLLSQFSAWLGKHKLTDFDREDVLKFLERQKWTNASKNCFLAALRGWAREAAGTEKFCKSMSDQRRLARLANIKDFKIEREEKPALSLEQISTLLDSMDPDTASLFWVLCWLGVRLGELKLIKKIDWKLGRLEVETEKSGGSRVLFFDDHTARLLRYAKDKKLLDLPGLAIWRRFKQYSGLVAPIKFTPHIARHSFGTHFSTLTDRDTLRRMLGHGARSATDIYVHRFDEQIREVMVEKHYLKPLEGEDAGA